MEMHINYTLHDCLAGELPTDQQEVFFYVTLSGKAYTGWFEANNDPDKFNEKYLGCFRVHKWSDVGQRTTIGFNVWKGKNVEVRYWTPVANPLVMLPFWLNVIDKHNHEEEE